MKFEFKHVPLWGGVGFIDNAEVFSTRHAKTLYFGIGNRVYIDCYPKWEKVFSHKDFDKEPIELANPALMNYVWYLIEIGKIKL